MKKYEITLNGKTIWTRHTSERVAMRVLERLSNVMASCNLTGVLELVPV